DGTSGSVLWQDVHPKEPWWVGIEAVYNDVVLLHEFSNPSLPEHKGVIALDLEEGKELWRNDQLTFWFAYHNSVYGYKTQFEKRVGFKLSLHSGHVEEEFGDAPVELNALRKLAQDEQQSDDFLFPEIMDRASLDQMVAAMVEKETKGESMVGNIEYVRQDPYLLMNFFAPGRSSTPETPALENHFSVIDLVRQRNIYSEVLATDAKAPTPDSFFLKGSFVYFIKDQRTLTALQLVHHASSRSL
ncbi:MAG: DUF4905 domain-containing protein, partial [Bacteroidota bacterium]